MKLKLKKHMVNFPIWKNGLYEKYLGLSVQSGGIIYKPSGIYEKWLAGLIVLGPVKRNQANQNGQKM